MAGGITLKFVDGPRAGYELLYKDSTIAPQQYNLLIPETLINPNAEPKKDILFNYAPNIIPYYKYYENNYDINYVSVAYYSVDKNKALNYNKSNIYYDRYLIPLSKNDFTSNPFMDNPPINNWSNNLKWTSYKFSFTTMPYPPSVSVTNIESPKMEYKEYTSYVTFSDLVSLYPDKELTMTIIFIGGRYDNHKLVYQKAKDIKPLYLIALSDDNKNPAFLEEPLQKSAYFYELADKDKETAIYNYLGIV